MKRRIKQVLSGLGVLPYLDIARRAPEIVRWVRSGCTSIAPSPVKRRIIFAYMKRYKLHQFIETGTYLGDTLAYVANDKTVKCISIELANHYYEEAKRRFTSYPNVSLLHGDSGVILPQCVCKLSTPALFWLDGHYSGGTTARGEFDTPVSIELQAILDSSIKTHVILIDDARCFDGSNNYPHLDTLLKYVRDKNIYDIEVSADIIRLTPKGKV